MIQFIACYLADWGSAETVFYPVLYCTMAGIVYMVIFSNTKKNGMCRMSLNSVKAFGIY
ncbi:hypothetical protein HTY54_28115 [Escherichia coli]|nr:hypothetical protein [Escherichia coli]